MPNEKHEQGKSVRAADPPDKGSAKPVAGDPALIDEKKLLRRAAEEGRISPEVAKKEGLVSGEFKCPVCGMYHWTSGEARECCINARPHRGE